MDQQQINLGYQKAESIYPTNPKDNFEFWLVFSTLSAGLGLLVLFYFWILFIAK